MSDTYVVIVDPEAAPTRVYAESPETYQITVSAAPGPPGPAGPDGGVLVHTQAVAAATWTIPHDLARIVGVDVYDEAGALIEGDVNVTDTVVTLSFSAPLAGKAVIG